MASVKSELSMKTRSAFQVRPAVPPDAVPLNAILSAIIAIGGTTAYQTALTDAEFDEHFISGPDCVACFVAETCSGQELIGFQAICTHQELPDGWVDIATFSRPEPRTPGVGSALFSATKTAAADLGLVGINATIRSDNRLGLPYYAKMGFETYDVLKGVPLQDGTPVDRVKKRFRLT